MAFFRPLLGLVLADLRRRRAAAIIASEEESASGNAPPTVCGVESVLGVGAYATPPPSVGTTLGKGF